MGGSVVQIGISGPVPEDLTVFETMRAEPDRRIRLWSRHLERLRRGCATVGFPLDEDAVAAALEGLPAGAVLRVRLAVDAAGRARVAHQPLPANPPFWRAQFSPMRLDSDDPWLRIKSSHRPIYEGARAALRDGCDEAILLNQRGEVCEGSITSLFLRRGDVMLTPPLHCGLLPGVLRASLLATGAASEQVLMPDDLSQGDLFCGNALRGLIPLRLIQS